MNEKRQQYGNAEIIDQLIATFIASGDEHRDNYSVANHQQSFEELAADWEPGPQQAGWTFDSFASTTDDDLIIHFYRSRSANDPNYWVHIHTGETSTFTIMRYMGALSKFESHYRAHFNIRSN